MLTPEQISTSQALGHRILDGLNARILGQQQLVKMVTVACLARGHVLLEGLPGLGKTELVKGLAGFLGLQFRRIQFTPDLLPSDITGAPVLEEKDGQRTMVFQPGPIFGNLILADEINRASPRTQAAMLEAMQEARVTAFGQTYVLPDPFWTLATQNPIDLEGTYPLPEAQLDRFMFKLQVYRVDAAVLQAIITSRRRGLPTEARTCLEKEEIKQLFDAVDQIFLPTTVASYISRLVEATHPDSSLAPPVVSSFVRYGASPRAAISIAEAARAHALLEGKPNAGFVDVEAVVLPTLRHRISLQYRAKLEGLNTEKIISAIIEHVSPMQEEIA